MAKLKFSNDDHECTVARGMYARDGEYVEFVKTCDCVGPVRFSGFYGHTYAHTKTYTCMTS
jgi:hypothetical protein